MTNKKGSELIFSIMNEQLRMMSEQVTRAVVSPVRWFVDALKAYREDRVEIIDVDLGNPFGTPGYEPSRYWKAVRFGGPIGRFIYRLRNFGFESGALYIEQDIPSVIEERRQEKKGLRA